MDNGTKNPLESAWGPEEDTENTEKAREIQKLHKKKEYARIRKNMFTKGNSRSTYLWFLLTWWVCLSFVIVVYHFITETHLFRFHADTLTWIDRTYLCIRGLIIIAIITEIMSLMFHEIKYIFGMEHLMFRKFLPTIRFLTIFITWVAGIFIILENIGINTSGLLAGAGIGGAIFALASKDIISNLLGSVFIIMSRIFDIGETIRVKNTEGIVEEITLNYTKIMSESGQVVFIPNRILNVEQIENITRRRFIVYKYKIPFKKSGTDPMEIRDRLMIIEGKINEYAPISTEITTEIPNANDFMYCIEVKLPEENEEFDREIRTFLIPYIFSEGK